MSKQIALITTAWGTRHGGINSFNYDLCKSLPKILGPNWRVVCIVLATDSDDKKNAEKNNVTLISLDSQEELDVIPPTLKHELWEKTNEAIDTPEFEWWIGHDLISGAIANAMPHVSKQGQSAIIKHMSYIDYSGFKHSSAALAQEKQERQTEIFLEADACFAVGPLLRDRLEDMLDANTKPQMLVPGLPDIAPIKPLNSFTAIAFGRLDPDNDKIKQGKLVVAAFSRACRLASEDLDRPETLRKNPRLKLFGVSESGGDGEAEIQKLAEKEAGKFINIVPLPFQENRAKLFKELAKSSVALMTSWHEGFGLVGWEAIAAEIPLILSEQSGLYQLLYEELGGSGIGCIEVVQVHGASGNQHYTDETATDVAARILKIASNRDYHRTNAKTLKSFLVQKNYTWESTARSLAKALKLDLAPATSTLHFPEKRVVLPLIQKAMCYNQGEYIQYSFLASEIHKKIKTKSFREKSFAEDRKESELANLCAGLDDFVNRNLVRISKKNFKFIEEYFEGRHPVSPRVSIKARHTKENVARISPIVRNTIVSYVSDYPLEANSGFSFVNENGKFFLCNDIPSRVATGEYVNARINIEAAKNYSRIKKKPLGPRSAQVKNVKAKYDAHEFEVDTDWTSCWIDKEEKTQKLDSNFHSHYKSTLIVPMTLRNNELDLTFRRLIGAKTDQGRAIFAYLCFDHVTENFFTGDDISMGYIFADILSCYWISRSIYTEFSESYRLACTEMHGQPTIELPLNLRSNTNGEKH